MKFVSFVFDPVNLDVPWHDADPAGRGWKINTEAVAFFGQVINYNVGKTTTTYDWDW